jgi:BirA family transcriptional regulator, biotin operon repressor / biotin---[acetyl-CoA-carboxylase] ligase
LDDDCCKGFILNQRIEFVDETASTNADILRRLQSGEPIEEGSWLVANRQISGRGRQGRIWEMEEGNFAGSTVIHHRDDDPPAQGLSLVAGISVYTAVASVLSDTSLLQLKWPNDLLLDGAKLAGILLERQGLSVVIGIGVNLVSSPDLPDRHTVALNGHGTKINRNEFANRLFYAMEKDVKIWRERGFAAVREHWLKLAHPIGTSLTVNEAGRMAIGGFAGLADDGALLLHESGGSVRTYYAGDTTLAENTGL